MTQVKKKEVKDKRLSQASYQTWEPKEWGFVPSNGLVLGGLDCQSLGPGLLLEIEACLSILSPFT